MLTCLILLSRISFAQEKKESKKETPASNERIKSNVGSNKSEDNESNNPKSSEIKRRTEKEPKKPN
jgi:hypothetical protein